ncbi:HD domain-containing phosphohydrolase [Microbacterium sp. NPDC056569]|uniref:HD domain-containing phosphohydrolase n=1 Tax=Microbacterium sp. NPDC056569 TaxID=3345867 RepID=UPI00366D521C
MVPAEDAGTGEAVHRHELLAALSRGIDLCMGQPIGHIAGQTYIALRLAERFGLDAEERREVFHTSMLAWVGCHVDSYEQARWFGDDHRVKADIRVVDLGDEAAALAFMVRSIGAGQPWPQRRRTLAAFRLDGQRETDEMFGNHRAAAAMVAEGLGILPEHRFGADQVFERWDGGGEPDGRRGSETTFSARAAALGDIALAIAQTGGTDAAVAVLRARRGTELDPDLVDAFCDDADEVLADVGSADVWARTLRLCPPLDDALASARLDDALVVLADYVDLKSPSGLGHQSATAAIADAAAEGFGFDQAGRTRVRRAALLHDIGRLGVPTAVWDSRVALTPAQTEQVRLHPYLTEVILDPFPSLHALGRLAGQHHERLDGSGYPRRLSGSGISPEGRLLAAADSYSSRSVKRPHRPAVPVSELPAVLRADVREGRLDADAVEAVLAAAGHRRSRRRAWPAGLTEREVDVLRLAARGRSNAEMARELHVSPKTIGNHLEHIYTKTGARNRAMVALFAARHSLLDEAVTAHGTE